MMSFQNMLGVFILLVIGVMVGFLIMIIEWIYASAKDGRKRIEVSAFIFGLIFTSSSNCYMRGRETPQLYDFELSASFDPVEETANGS